MNKSDVVNGIAQSTGLSKKDAAAALNAFTDIITGELKRNNRVSLTGFGTFDVSHRAARVGVNPQTRERIQIPPTKVARFRAGKELKVNVR